MYYIAGSIKKSMKQLDSLRRDLIGSHNNNIHTTQELQLFDDSNDHNSSICFLSVCICVALHSSIFSTSILSLT